MFLFQFFWLNTRKFNFFIFSDISKYYFIPIIAADSKTILEIRHTKATCLVILHDK